MDLGLVVNIAAAIGQVLAAFFALAALIFSLKTAREQQSMSERIASEHQALQIEQLRMQRDSDILRWTERCIECLSDADVFASGLAGSAADFYADQRLAAIQMRLSALIDQGRMYFPNQAPESKGQEKPPAYQGERQRILSMLVHAHFALDGLKATHDPAKCMEVCQELLDLRRHFVSEAQIAIDPRRYVALKEMNQRRTEFGMKPQTPDEKEWRDPPRPLTSSHGKSI